MSEFIRGVIMGSVTALVGFISALIPIFKDIGIKSKQPIKPTIKIGIENGISDTTYIYRR